jgi:hypothetical protein
LVILLNREIVTHNFPVFYTVDTKKPGSISPAPWRVMRNNTTSHADDLARGADLPGVDFVAFGPDQFGSCFGSVAANRLFANFVG